MSACSTELCSVYDNVPYLRLIHTVRKRTLIAFTMVHDNMNVPFVLSGSDLCFRYRLILRCD